MSRHECRVVTDEAGVSVLVHQAAKLDKIADDFDALEMRNHAGCVRQAARFLRLVAVQTHVEIQNGGPANLNVDPTPSTGAPS